MKSEEEEGKREQGTGNREKGRGIAVRQAQGRGRGEHSGEVRLNSAIRNPKSAIHNFNERGYDHGEDEDITEQDRGESA